MITTLYDHEQYIKGLYGNGNRIGNQEALGSSTQRFYRNIRVSKTLLICNFGPKQYFDEAKGV